MHHKTSIERILAVEDAMDVTRIRYKSLKLWPFIRMQIWRRLIQPHKFAPPGTIGLNYLAQKLSQSFFKPDFYVPYLEHAKRHRENLTLLSKAGKVDILFFSKSEEYSDTIQGQYYNRFLDPLIDLAKTRYTYQKVELISDTTSRTLPRREHTHFLDTQEYIRCDAQRSIINAFQNNGNGSVLEGGDEVSRILAGIRFDLALTEEYLMVEAERILHYVRYFRETLRILQPKIVFLSGYYDELSMALIAACKAIGVKTVDVQRHGLGVYHGMYTHWRHIPEDGYQLLPDYFWCWSKADVEYLQSWNGSQKMMPRPVIGGNTWLSRWLDADSTTSSNPIEQQLNESDAQHFRILVTLTQAEDCLPDNLLQAIRNSPRQWLWMLRTHPGMEHKVEEITSLFADLKVFNVNVLTDSQIPVYKIMKYVDWHVSEWSPLGVEALRFGIPTLIIHDEGKEIFSQYIESGVFSYAKTPEEILERLSGTPPVIEDPESYVVTNPIYALDTLLEVMEDVVESMVA